MITRLFHQKLTFFGLCVCFNATFNNIPVISWRSVLLVEETEDPEKTTDLPQVTDKFYHIMLYTSPWSRFELTTSVVIGTECIGNCKSNYHTITNTTPPIFWYKSEIQDGHHHWTCFIAYVGSNVEYSPNLWTIERKLFWDVHCMILFKVVGFFFMLIRNQRLSPQRLSWPKWNILRYPFLRIYCQIVYLYPNEWYRFTRAYS